MTRRVKVSQALISRALLAAKECGIPEVFIDREGIHIPVGPAVPKAGKLVLVSSNPANGNQRSSLEGPTSSPPTVGTHGGRKSRNNR
jgi:hypothetical protein